MKRFWKNTIHIIIICLLIALNAITIYAAVHSSSDSLQPTGGAPSGQSELQSGSSGGNGGTPPDMQSGTSENGSAPAQMPNGNNAQSGSADSQTPPAKPDGDATGNNSAGDGQSAPQMPSGNSAPSGNSNGTPPDNNQQGVTASGQEPPQMANNSDVTQNASGGQPSENSNASSPEQQSTQTNTQSSVKAHLSITYYVALSVESFLLAIAVMYLILSKGNKDSLKETFGRVKKITLFILSVLLITAALAAGECYAIDTYIGQSSTVSVPSASAGTDSGSSAEAAGVLTVSDTQTLSEAYSSTQSDESAVLVKSGGNLTLSNASVTKTGDSSNTENSEFYGINSAVLVTENATATIRNATISTDASGSNAVFSTGSNSKIYISDSTITSSGKSSARGLDATYGGYIEANKVSITTQGGSCATLATDRGEGTVIANDATLETNGSGSPLIYSTGTISLSGSTGTANASQIVVVEGKNSASVDTSSLSCSGAGNRGDTDIAGIMLYQSMSGDASVGTGNFSSKDSTLSIDSASAYYATAPMFFVTNTDAVIDLENTTLRYGSNILLRAAGTDEWGTSGSNGGQVSLKATNQQMAGNILVDNISSLDMELNSSSYSGTINADNTAKSIDVTLDADSSITLTGDSYITSLNDADSSYGNIVLNGYKLYVNGTALVA